MSEPERWPYGPPTGHPDAPPEMRLEMPRRWDAGGPPPVVDGAVGPGYVRPWCGKCIPFPPEGGPAYCCDCYKVLLRATAEPVEPVEALNPPSDRVGCE